MGRGGNANAVAAQLIGADAPKVRLASPGIAGAPSKELAQPVMLIGGRRDCDLPIQHGDVSQVHCAIVNNGRDIIVADLCSRTGTYVNDERVSIATLRSGDKLRVGALPVEVTVIDGPRGRSTASEDPTRLARPMRLLGDGVDVTLETLPAVIGRRAACAVLLDTPDVSLAHALLLMINDVPVIYDLGSRSGSYLNGKRVALAPLVDGDELSIGGLKLTSDWAGPAREAIPEARPVAAAAVSAAASAPSLPDIPLNPGDDLDAVLAGLQNHLWAMRSKLLERSMNLDQREATILTRAEQIEAEAAGFEERENTLQAREQDLARRLRELADRETMTAETARRIEQFKSALNDASQRLTGLGVGGRRPPDAPIIERPMFDALAALTDPGRRLAGS